MPGLVRGQPSRFATLLLYLNDDGLEGGETAFPLWRNAETSKQLEVKPEKGKAVLFYNLLPDGNYDELSMHAALPVRKGEKYLANLWVWVSSVVSLFASRCT
jgi:prolyl 4-hydroxylase